MTSISIHDLPSFNLTALKRYSGIAVLVDENTRELCYTLVKDLLPPHQLIEVPAGEEHKNLATCQFIWQRLTEYQFDRHSLMIILGGGVLGDMGGFCAATYKRGIDFMLVPTTLLSQVDASIGGKLGIDFGSFKNHLGVFQLPVQTRIATTFLQTLPHRELRSGFAEVIKHCIISDKKMWDYISGRPMESQPWTRLVRHSVKFKNTVVAKDPREKGLRQILNFGHTIGHALEGHFLSTGNRVFHGEAVAAGMVMESRIAAAKGMLQDKELQSISQYVHSVFGKIELPQDGQWLTFLKQDKKNRGNKILMALPKHIGKAVWGVPVSEKEILAAVDYYRSR
jgi:3-dehydroquinate synthase